MRLLKFLLPVITILVVESTAHSADITFKYGLGFGTPNQTTLAEVKFFELGYQGTIWSVLKHKIGAGLWADAKSDGRERSSSGFAAYSLGVRVEPSIFYVESFWGVAIITSPDKVLSGYFQFTQDLALGVKDSKGRFIGLSYKHFSNAGIIQPNIGRDFILVNVGVGL